MSVILGHALDGDRPDLLDGAVVHIVCGRHLEVVLGIGGADEGGARLHRIGQLLLPGPHLAEAVADAEKTTLNGEINEMPR